MASEPHWKDLPSLLATAATVAREYGGYLRLLYVPFTTLGAEEGLDLRWEVNLPVSPGGEVDYWNGSDPEEVLQAALQHIGRAEPAVQRGLDPQVAVLLSELTQLANGFPNGPDDDSSIELTYDPSRTPAPWRLEVVAGDGLGVPAPIWDWIAETPTAVMADALASRQTSWPG